MSTHQTSSVRAQAPGERKDWRHDAYCRDHDPELWFGTGDSSPGHDLHQWELAAKWACTEHCSVRAECLAWAFQSDQKFGVAGGMAAQERERVQRRRAS
jgi:WhiB family redox-sensing transcriptional regulator